MQIKPLNILTMTYKQAITSFITFLCILITNAQEGLLFHHITRSEGLLHDNATCVAQDSLGFIWLGTHRGINRFDGYRLDAYKYEKDPINSVYYNRVQSICPTDRYLWIATAVGVACFDVKSKQYVDFTLEDSQNKDFYTQVKHITKGANGELWLLSDRQLRRVKVSRKDNRPTLKALPIGKDYKLTTEFSNPQLAVSEKGDVWISGATQLIAYHYTQGNNLQPITISSAPDGAGVVAMHYAQGCLWVLYHNHLAKYRLDANGYTLLSERSFDSHKELLSLCFTDNYVWVCNEERIFQLSKELQLVREHSHSPSNPRSIQSHINSIYVDRSNNLWVTAWSDGVAYAAIGEPFFKTVRIKAQSNIGSEFVSTMHYDLDGYVYIGNKFGGIVRFNTYNHTLEEHYCDLPELTTNITSIQSDAQHLYVSAREFVYVIDKQSHKLISSFQPQSKDYIFDLKLDAYHRLWSTTYSGLECFERRAGTWQHLYTFTDQSPEPYRLSTILLHKIYADLKNNELVVTSAKGINRILLHPDGSVRRVLTYLADEHNPHSLSSNYLWAIDKDKDTYWIGTMGSGLNRLTFHDRPNEQPSYTAEHYGVAQGASSNDIESVQVDRFGNVWCGGFYLSYFSHRLQRFASFDTSDGLQGHSFGTASSCKDAMGNLYFGGNHGFNYFYPTEHIPQPKLSHVYFTRYTNGGKVIASDIEHQGSLSIAYPNNDLTLYFSTLTYKEQQHIRYRYKLEGYDTDWQYLEQGKDPSAAYQRIPYGHYRFVVQAGDWSRWSATYTTLGIYSAPPFWLSWWAYLLYGLLTIGLLYLAVRYFIRWTQMKHTIAAQAEKERHKEELMQMKMQFFTDVSHEFRTPLTLMGHAIDELSDDLSDNSHIHTLRRNTAKLSNMVNELLEIHRMDIYTPELKASYCNVSAYVRAIYNEFEQWAATVPITMELTTPEEDITMWIDQKYFGKLLSNILSNSIRYSHPHSTIRLSISIGDLSEVMPLYKNSFSNTTRSIAGRQLIVKVADEGVGLEKSALPEIFERFHRVGNSQQKRQGSGIGLSLVKSLIEAHCGSICISSKVGVGTEFIFTIPLSDTYLTDKQRITESTFVLKDYLSDYAPEYEHTPEEEPLTTEQDDKPTLLLVDDNHEVLMILRSLFMRQYNCILASDGVEALEKCSQHFPSLIISDVMMPKMDGFELCATLKKNLQTCYIPIILLTAKAQIEDEIAGTELGADAYMTKPFDAKLLKLKVRNLLRGNKPLSEAENTRQQAIDHRQRELLAKFITLIEGNLSNPHFSVDNLCLELGMNRTKLYQFVKATTGLTLANYIRKIRLDKAAEWLRTTDMLISEVCYKVGIDSPSYFTRAFKEQFGVSPSEYIRK